MRVDHMNWMQVEERLRFDNRCVLPLGCTEQHAYLSLATDTILAERLAIEAASPLGVPVFPGVPYGVTPAFLAYPGTVSLRLSTYGALLSDVLDSLAQQGFKRFLLVNGHGGNTPARTFVAEWAQKHSTVRVRWHDWWNSKVVWAKVVSFDAEASHASWMENFPWTRLPGLAHPETAKPMMEFEPLRCAPPSEVRQALRDGNFGGRYERPDSELEEIWRVAVEEVRSLIESM